MYFKLLPAERLIALVLRRKQFSTIPPKAEQTASYFILAALNRVVDRTTLSHSHLLVLSPPLPSTLVFFSLSIQQQVSITLKTQLKSIVENSTKRLAHFSTTVELA